MKIKLLKSLVGQKVCLEPAEVDNWSDVISNLPTDKECTFEFYYGGFGYTGAVSLIEDGSQLCILFDQDHIALPSNMCLDVTCGDSCDPQEENETGCPNNEIEITDETKFAILDEDGCPKGYLTFADLKTEVIKCIKVEDLDFKLCDLFPDNEIPQGDLVVSDRILTTGGNCSFKSVSQTDLKCPEPDAL